MYVFNNLFRSDSAGSRTRDHRQMHITIRLERHGLLVLVIVIVNVIFSFSLKTFSFF